MEVAPTRLRKERDFFRLSAPLSVVGAPGCGEPEPRILGPNLVLELERREKPAKWLIVDGRSTPVIPYPVGTQSLVRVATTALAWGARGGDWVDLLVARRTFDQLADEHGVPRPTKLNVHAGIATGDVVMRHLGACLDLVLEQANPGVAAVDRISEALHFHIAQQYAEWRRPQPPRSGALATWQLRVAKHTLNSCLEGAVTLEDIARRCGLSTSHFSRAFTRSTGLAPHRWLTRRRIEAAKDMILSGAMPLAQIAVACGFSDQSHFTRSFAAITGLTPSRWRASQEHMCPSGQAA